MIAKDRKNGNGLGTVDTNSHYPSVKCRQQWCRTRQGMACKHRMTRGVCGRKCVWTPAVLERQEGEGRVLWGVSGSTLEGTASAGCVWGRVRSPLSAGCGRSSRGEAAAVHFCPFLETSTQ